MNCGSGKILFSCIQIPKQVSFLWAHNILKLSDPQRVNLPPNDGHGSVIVSERLCVGVNVH